MGRPSKLTAQVQEKIVQAILGGNFREVAARYAGVAPETVSRWLAQDRPPYAAFRQALLEAEQIAEMRAVARILKAGEDDPKHLEWWLERKFPDRWGRRERVDLEVYVRQRAGELGLDADEALAEATRIIGNPRWAG